MPIYWDKAKKRWRFTFNRILEGARYRHTKLLPAGWSRTRADAFERQHSARLYAQASGLERPAPLIEEAVQLYLDHRIPKLRDGINAARELGAVLPWFEGKLLKNLPAVARDYASDQADKLAPATIRNRLAYLKAAARYAWKKHGLVDADPAACMELPAVNNERQVYLRVKDLGRLLAKFDDPEAAALFRMAFYTGLRWRAELLPRKPADVVRRGRQRWLLVGTTKNGTPRMVPVHPAIAGDLKRLPFSKPWYTFSDAFERARTLAGMKHVRPHDLRHSLASEIVSRGGTLVDVQGALHHRSALSSRRYAHLYPERVRQVLLQVATASRRKDRPARKMHTSRTKKAA